MAECTTCPFCPGGALDRARELARVPAIIRERRNEVFTVWRCPRCASLHCKESVELDAYYAAYPLARLTEDPLSRLFLRKRMARLAAAGVRESDAILDFGCGTGLFVRLLREHGYARVEGYDAYIPEFRDEAIMDAKYDVVLAQDVIEHAEDPEAMLIRMLGCLRPGGLLCLGTPRAERIRLAQADAYAVSLHQPYHRHIFSTAALVTLARRHGLELHHTLGRYVGESAAPFGNVLFIHEYIRRLGNVIDVGFEPVPKGFFQKNPLLIFYAFVGYWLSRRSEMVVWFRYRTDALESEPGLRRRELMAPERSDQARAREREVS
jgi:SAM-dependent methyltransferase